MQKLKAIWQIITGNASACALSNADRDALVKQLRVKADAAAATSTTFPLEMFPQANGSFTGREAAYRDAATLVEAA